MALDILQKTNTDGPDSEYPLGKIRNKTMSQIGTPVNVETYGDFHQFFAKILFDAGIAANGQFDNEYNGYQLVEALYYHCKNQRNYDRFYLKLTQGGTSAPTVDYQAENDFGVSGTLSYQSVGDYRITFPSGTFPDSTKVFFHIPGLPGGATCSLSISGTTILRIRTYDASGTPANDLLNLSDIYVMRYE